MSEALVEEVDSVDGGCVLVDVDAGEGWDVVDCSVCSLEVDGGGVDAGVLAGVLCLVEGAVSDGGRERVSLSVPGSWGVVSVGTSEEVDSVGVVSVGICVGVSLVGIRVGEAVSDVAGAGELELLLPWLCRLAIFIKRATNEASSLWRASMALESVGNTPWRNLSDITWRA